MTLFDIIIAKLYAMCVRIYGKCAIRVLNTTGSILELAETVDTVIVYDSYAPNKANLLLRNKQKSISKETKNYKYIKRS